MINESIQNADETMLENEEVTKLYEEYEILFYEENFKYYQDMEF
jgi:hypothetical protein